MSELGQLPGVQYYLQVIIKGNKLNPINIIYLIIREWIFNIIPTLELQIIDDGYLTEITPMEDGEDINIILAKHEDDENPIDVTFSLDDYSVSIVGDNRKSIVTLTGHLKVNDMFILKNRSFSKRSSKDVLSQIANEAGITFLNPHNINTSDSMIWYQSNLSNFNFIKHVLRRAYIPDDVLFFYANIYKKFILTSLNSEINKQNTKKSKFNIKNFEQNVKDDKDPDDTIWFSSYNIVNASGYFNKKYGYGFKYNYYDLENFIEKSYNKIKKISDLSFRNKKMVGNSVQQLSNIEFIERNLYGPEYFESLLRNQFLKNNFFANSLVLNVNALSKVYLMDKIQLDIPSLFVENELNQVMSGFYIVAGVQHEVSKGGIYKKKLALSRNGMNMSSYIKKENYQVEVL